MSVVVPHIIKFDSVDSTNSLLKELAQKGANEGTVVVATTQHAGRGRGGRIGILLKVVFIFRFF